MNKKIALTHKPTPQITQCELTFLERTPINYERALSQHENYCHALKHCGLKVEVLNVNPASPDAVFVEDCALVLDEIAVIASMGSASRQAEISAMARILSSHRELVHLKPPAQLEGGDVLQINKRLYVGLSSRTNFEGIEALRRLVQPFGYEVFSVKVKECLHLKTGVTALDAETLLANRKWIDLAPFADFEIIDVAEDEPFGANALPIGKSILMSASMPLTIERVQNHGFEVLPIDISEFAKAEAGLTCMSLIFNAAPA